MERSSAEDISSLLHAWCGGDTSALNRLVPLVYDELHNLAHHYMQKERSNLTLQTTALVNEAFLRLVKAKEIDWKDRNHFFAISANVMRRILVDFARTRGYRKRGGGLKKISLDADLLVSSEPDPDLVALDDALNRFAELDPGKARVVELHFFGGLTWEETAAVMGISRTTARREWRTAKVWLLCELEDRGKLEP